MTKKLLLAAAAAGVMAFAGAASAGDISGTVSGIEFKGGDSATAKSYVIAAETQIAAPIATAADGFVASNKLTTPIKVIDGTTQNYVVKFEITGGVIPATATVTPRALNVATPVAVTFASAGRTATSVTYVATVTAAGTDVNVTHFEIAGVLEVASSAAPVTVKGSVDLLAGGSTFNVDTAAAVTAVSFKPLLANVKATGKTATAALPDFKLFKTAGGTADLGDNNRTATLATGFSASNSGTFYKNLAGAAGVVTLADMLNGGVAVVTGPQALSANLAPTLTGTRTFANGAAIFTMDVDQSRAFAAHAGTTALSVTQAEAAANRVAMGAGSYNVAWTPTLNPGYVAVSPSSTTAAGSVSLDGTNFTAPWFTLNNANNTAFLRLANNGSTATGPVFVELKAHNGTAAPTTARVKVADSIAPNGVFQITGPELATLFGSNAQNGDLAVTIQGDGNVISGKVRVRNATGALSEQSLGNLGSSAK